MISGNVPNDPEQYRHDAELGRDRDRERLAQQARGREGAAPMGRANSAMPALAPHESANATECNEERVDQQENDDRVGRAPARLDAGRPLQRSEQRDRRHRRRPQHRRLEAGHRREHQHDRERGRSARTRAEAGGATARRTPSRTRRSRPIPRADATARESRYVIDHRRRNTARVAEQEPGDERACSRRRGTGAPQNHSPDRVRRPRAARAVTTTRSDLDVVELGRPRGASGRDRRTRRTRVRSSRPCSTTWSPASTTRSAATSSPVARASSVRWAPLTDIDPDEHARLRRPVRRDPRSPRREPS